MAEKVVDKNDATDRTAPLCPRFCPPPPGSSHAPPAYANPRNAKAPAGNSGGGLTFSLSPGYRLAARPTQK